MVLAVLSCLYCCMSQEEAVPFMPTCWVKQALRVQCKGYYFFRLWLFSKENLTICVCLFAAHVQTQMLRLRGSPRQSMQHHFLSSRRLLSTLPQRVRVTPPPVCQPPVNAVHQMASFTTFSFTSFQATSSGTLPR